MRLAALICGLAAGLFALATPGILGSSHMEQFLALLPQGENMQLAGRLVWFAIPVIAILGGLVARALPGFGGFLLAVATLGWLGLGFLLPGAFDLMLMLPLAAAGLGAIIAFTTSEIEARRDRLERWEERREEREDGRRDDRRDNRRAAAQRREPEPRRERRNAPLERIEPGDAPRQPAPSLAPEATARTGRNTARGDENYARATPRPRIIEPVEDIEPDEPSAEEIAEREAALRMDPLLFDPDEVDHPADEIPLTLDQISPPPRRPRRPEREALEAAPETVTGPVESERKSRSRRGRTRGEGLPWPEARPGFRSVNDRDEDEEATGWRAVPRWVIGANVVVVVVLGLAVAWMVLAHGSRPTRFETASTGSAIASKDEAKLPPLNLAPLASGAGEGSRVGVAMPEMPGDPTTPRPADLAANGARYDNPFAYCAAVGTADYVDARYVGPRFTPEIAEALHVPTASAPDRVRWRCYSGTVFACTSFDWPVCDVTPAAEEMVAFCQRNPDVPRLMAPNGVWNCENGRPHIPEGASWPVDDRGFFPQAWVPVLPAGRTTG